jgi:TRAP-type C4-dicarboxylate transport system permease small subunit
VIYLRLPPPARRALDLATAILGIGLCAYVAKSGTESMLREIRFETLLPSGYLPAWPQTLAIPLCFAAMAIAYLSFLYAVLAGRGRQPVHPASDSVERP